MLNECWFAGVSTKKKILSDHLLIFYIYVSHIYSPENKSLFVSRITVIQWLTHSLFVSMGECVLMQTFFRKMDRDVGEAEAQAKNKFCQPQPTKDKDVKKHAYILVCWKLCSPEMLRKKIIQVCLGRISMLCVYVWRLILLPAYDERDVR